MTNSNLFKQAHTMTKATIKAGDNYQATFGQCLKTIKAAQVKTLKKAPTDIEAVCDYMTGFVLTTIIAFMLALMFFVVALHSAPVAVVCVCSIVTVIAWAIWDQVKHRRVLGRSSEIIREV